MEVLTLSGTLGGVLDQIFGSFKNISTLAILFFGYRWLKRGAALGFIMTMGAYFLGALGVLSVLGVVSVNLGALLNLLGALADLIGSALLVASVGEGVVELLRVGLEVNLDALRALIPVVA